MPCKRLAACLLLAPALAGASGGKSDDVRFFPCTGYLSVNIRPHPLPSAWLSRAVAVGAVSASSPIDDLEPETEAGARLDLEADPVPTSAKVATVFWTFRPFCGDETERARIELTGPVRYRVSSDEPVSLQVVAGRLTGGGCAGLSGAADVYADISALRTSFLSLSASVDVPALAWCGRKTETTETTTEEMRQ